MKQGDYTSPDDCLRVALETLEGVAIEDLDPDTQAALGRADAQANRGEGMPVDDAFARLRQKHFGK
jgi:Arc/MetJ-type ribon-helix-helix transcriptional regulator